MSRLTDYHLYKFCQLVPGVMAFCKFKISQKLFIPPQTMFVVVYTVFTLRVHPSFHPCVRLSVTFWFFLNILKRQLWKFIKLCIHIDIDKMYVYNKELRARAQFCWSYCPL